MQKKIRTHRFADNHPIASALLLILSFLLVSSIGLMVNALIALVLPSYPVAEGSLGSILCSLLALWLYKRWFSPEFEGNLKGGRPAEALRPSVLFAVLWVLVLGLTALHPEDQLVFPTLQNIGFAVAAGVGEEIFLRGMPLSLMMRRRRSAGWITASLLITSLSFGLFHALNLLAGASLTLTLLQVLGTVGIGLLLGAIYLRTGSLIPVMILHTAHDFVAFCSASIQETGGVMSQTEALSALNLVMLTVPYLIMGAAGLWLVRPAKNPELREIWNGKWRFAPSENEPSAEM